MDPLTRCVGDVEAFFAQHWERAPALHQGSFDDLLSLDDVDGLINASGLRAPGFRLVRDGRTLPVSQYTRRGRIGSRRVDDLVHSGKVFALFDQGATIVLQGLHRSWEPVRAFCRSLEQSLHHPVQANAYITPPVATGLRVHADPHDVFAIQTFGRKHWVVYAPGDDDGTAAALIDTFLTAGDCLYLPRGTPHAARTVDDPSIHLTVGIKPLTWRSVLAETVADILAQPSFDRALPPAFGAHPDHTAKDLRSALDELAHRLTTVTDTALVGRARDLLRHAGHRGLDGQLHQLLRVDAIDDRTHVRPRDGVQTLVADDRFVVRLDDRELRLPLDTEPALRVLLEPSGARVGDLRTFLDEPGRQALVRRLVREGVVTTDG